MNAFESVETGVFHQDQIDVSTDLDPRVGGNAPFDKVPAALQFVDAGRQSGAVLSGLFRPAGIQITDIPDGHDPRALQHRPFAFHPPDRIEIPIGKTAAVPELRVRQRLCDACRIAVLREHQAVPADPPVCLRTRLQIVIVPHGPGLIIAVADAVSSVVHGVQYLAHDAADHQQTLAFYHTAEVIAIADIGLGTGTGHDGRNACDSARTGIGRAHFAHVQAVLNDRKLAAAGNAAGRLVARHIGFRHALFHGADLGEISCDPARSGEFILSAIGRCFDAAAGDAAAQRTCIDVSNDASDIEQGLDASFEAAVLDGT